MADNDIAAYPYMFDASQLANKYSNYANKKLPFMGQYASQTPTDAHGNPIQSYVDAQAAHDAWKPSMAAPVTLNSNPTTAGLEPQGSAARAMQNAGYGDWALLDPTLAASRAGQQGGAGSVAATTGWNPANPASATGTAAGGVGGGTAGMGGATGGQTQQTNPVDMGQAYLTALSNPGKVTTPGATVPQSAPPSNQSGVLQQFMQNWQNGGGQTQGAGNYNNAGFFNALKGMV